MNNDDIRRIILVLTISLLIGIITNHVTVFLFAGLLIYLYWHLRLLTQLLLWLRKRSDKQPPEVPGVIDEIAREFDYLRARHKKRKKKLTGYLKRFQQATAALPDAVVILGAQGVIEWANNKAKDYLGIHWPQDAGQRIANLIRHPDLPDYLRPDNPEREKARLELISPVNPGLRLELRSAPYGGRQQLLVARDISKIYLIQKMRRDFIANASHELRTPLTVLSGYLENLADDVEISRDILRTQVIQMRSQTERMQRLIDDLLILASLESSQEEITMDVVRIPELLTAIYKEANTVSGMLDHIFTIEVKADLWLKGSQKELYSAFSNIIFNAVQYTPAHGVIEIRWYADDSGAHLEVSDTGDGISREHLSRLTERFYRVDKGRSRERGGTGLGLAIVKHVLTHHKANLEIESEVGIGSLFRCNFPTSAIIWADDSTTVSKSA